MRTRTSPRNQDRLWRELGRKAILRRFDRTSPCIIVAANVNERTITVQLPAWPSGIQMGDAAVLRFNVMTP